MKNKWKFISRGGESRLVVLSFSIRHKYDKKLSNPSSLKRFIFSNLMATSSMCSVVVDVAEMQQCRECRQRRRAGRGTRSGPWSLTVWLSHSVSSHLSPVTLVRAKEWDRRNHVVQSRQCPGDSSGLLGQHSVRPVSVDQISLSELTDQFPSAPAFLRPGADLSSSQCPDDNVTPSTRTKSRRDRFC